MLDCVALYNRVFRSTAYKVIGYGRNDAGIFCAVLEQPLVKGRTINRFCQESGLEETYVSSILDAVMLQLGFQKMPSTGRKTNIRFQILHGATL